MTSEELVAGVQEHLKTLYGEDVLERTVALIMDEQIIDFDHAVDQACVEILFAILDGVVEKGPEDGLEEPTFRF